MDTLIDWKYPEPGKGLEWFIPLLFIKLLISHLIRDEPYAAKERM
jgi:hypothetical protein